MSDFRIIHPFYSDSMDMSYVGWLEQTLPRDSKESSVFLHMREHVFHFLMILERYSIDIIWCNIVQCTGLHDFINEPCLVPGNAGTAAFVGAAPGWWHSRRGAAEEDFDSGGAVAPWRGKILNSSACCMQNNLELAWIGLNMFKLVRYVGCV